MAQRKKEHFDGKSLRRMRKARNLTQEQVGVEVDVTQQSIKQWENGKTTPSAKNTEKLCELFGVPYWEFLTKEAEWAYENFVVSAWRGMDSPTGKQREQTEHLLKVAEKLNALPLDVEDDDDETSPVDLMEADDE